MKDTYHFYIYDPQRHQKQALDLASYDPLQTFAFEIINPTLREDSFFGSLVKIPLILPCLTAMAESSIALKY